MEPTTNKKQSNIMSTSTYNLTPQEQIELDKFWKENLDKGYIQPSQSPMGSPFFFVDKKNGKLRPCQDYWYLNEHTIKNAFPLPLISKPLDKIKGAWWFTKLDVWWGYNNVRIRDGDHWKVAFKKWAENFLNQQWYSLECVTHQQHSKQLWTTLSEIWSTTALWSYTWMTFDSLHQTKRHWWKTPRRF